jgi:hypothetical protein
MQKLFEPPRSESRTRRIARLVRARIEQFRIKARTKIAGRRDEDPDEPYALVGAPLKPRTPLRTLKAAAKPPLF